jgi:hypothetical protein
MGLFQEGFIDMPLKTRRHLHAVFFHMPDIDESQPVFDSLDDDITQ